MTKIVDYDPHTGITETYFKDYSTGEVKINRSQNTGIVTDLNTRERNAASSNWGGDMHKVATVPLIVIEQWREELKRKGYDNPDPLAACNRDWFLARLNHRDFKMLRTKEGMI